MEALAPPLRLLQVVRYNMESGASVRQGLLDYLRCPADSWTSEVRAWVMLLERGCATTEFLRKIKSPARKNLLTVLERGIAGEPVLSLLIGLEEELKEQSLMEIEAFLGRLPFRMLLPLLFFLFPSFLILLLGPLLLGIAGSVG